LAAFAVLGPGLLARAQAAETVFTVGNYPVEARADNAVAAKNQALADGQQAAFRSLLKRLVPVTAYPRIRRLASVKAGDLIDGYKVRSERNSATEYIASLDFSFQSKAVRDLLRREGIPFSDEQSPTLTVIPVWRDGPTGTPRDDSAWTNIWKGLDLEHALTPVNLQTLRKEIQPSTINALAGGDGTAIRSLAGTYRSEHILIVMGEHDPAAKRLNIVLSGRDAVGAFTLPRAYRLDASDPAYTSELAAVVALGVLEGRWKSTKTRGGGGGCSRHWRCCSVRARRSAHLGRVPRHGRMAGHQPQAGGYARYRGTGRGRTFRARRARDFALCWRCRAVNGCPCRSRSCLAQRRRQLGHLGTIGPLDGSAARRVRSGG
jgi:hypothetical protein